MQEKMKLLKTYEYNELVKQVSNITTTDTNNLVKISDCNTKISKIENKINDHDHAK